MIKIKDITQYLESWAPPSLQEDYDNSGLITGNSNVELRGVIVALDCTEEVVEEAPEAEAAEAEAEAKPEEEAPEAEPAKDAPAEQ